MTNQLAPQELADFICVELDPLMTSNGFQAGQSGIGYEVGVIYCTPHADFRRRFPELAPEVQYNDDGACTDLHVNAGNGPRARLHDVRLDGVPLAAFVADIAPDLADEAEQIAQLPSDVGVPRLRDLLEIIFTRAAAPTNEGANTDV